MSSNTTKDIQKLRIIRDTIWGDIDISDPILKGLIDNPMVQRLRRIRMTDFAFFSFPSLSATRFEHSLGTVHLLKKFYYSNKEISPKDEQKYYLCIILALFHHAYFPPFSYATKPVFDEILGTEHLNLLHRAIADYVFRLLNNLCKAENREPVFQNGDREFYIELISKGIARSRKISVQYPREFYEDIFWKCFAIPSGVNFIEAVCRDAILSGIGMSFNPDIVASQFSKEKGKHLFGNIKALIHNVESLIDMIYIDEVNLYCSAFIQKLLYGVYKQKEGSYYNSEFMKPIKSFVGKINDLKSKISSYKESPSRERIEAVVDVLIDIDDFALFSAFKQTLIGVGKHIKIERDEEEKTNLTFLEKVLKFILYGGNQKDFDLKKIQTDVEFLFSDSIPICYEVSKILEHVNTKMGFDQKAEHPFYSLFIHIPRSRVRHYFENLEEMKKKYSDTVEIIKIIEQTQSRLSEEYEKNIWVIKATDKQNITGRATCKIRLNNTCFWC